MSTIPKAHMDAVTCVKMTPNENIVVSTGKDHTVKLWDVRTWKQLGSTFEHSAYTTALAGGCRKSEFCISPNGQYIVLGSNDGSVIVLDIANGKIQMEEVYCDEHRLGVVGAAWMPSTKNSTFATIDKSG